jgi:hypothetical protein
MALLLWHSKFLNNVFKCPTEKFINLRTFIHLIIHSFIHSCTHDQSRQACDGSVPGSARSARARLVARFLPSFPMFPSFLVVVAFVLRRPCADFSLLSTKSPSLWLLRSPLLCCDRTRARSLWRRLSHLTRSSPILWRGRERKPPPAIIKSALLLSYHFHR